MVVAFVPPAAHAQAMQQYEYQPDRIYPVRTGLGITTQIELSPNEKILDYSTGFSGGWELTRRDNVFYLKPKNVDVDTNMMIRTATHSYIFELKVVATDWKTLEQARRAGVQYKITFTYPSDASFSSAKRRSKKRSPRRTRHWYLAAATTSITTTPRVARRRRGWSRSMSTTMAASPTSR